MQLNDQYHEHLHRNEHEAIVMTVERKLSTHEASAVNARILKYIEACNPSTDMLPVWTRFKDVDGADIYFLQGSMCAVNRPYLKAMLIDIDELDKFKVTASFDYHAKQFPKRRGRMAQVRRA